MKIDTVLVKVASRCNINCSYCYVYNMGDEGWRDMPHFISGKTIQALSIALKSLYEDQCTPFAVVLHGGEPLMLGPRRLENLLGSLRAVLGLENKICMQTNGMLITDSILDICDRYATTISVSLDGPSAVHNRFRVGHRGENTFDKVVEGIEKLRSHRAADFLFSGLLTVIDPSSDPSDVYAFLKKFGAPSLDFLYRDGNHTTLPFGKAALQSTEYGQWLCGLAEAYLADPAPVRIRLLDDLVRLTLGAKGLKEGVGVTDFGIAIIDTDGSISKNDTLKSSFNGADRFAQTWNVFDHRLSEIFEAEEFQRYHLLQRPSSEECSACPHLHVCGGGMPLHRWSREREYDNPSVYCSDQKMIINHIHTRLVREGVLN